MITRLPAVYATGPAAQGEQTTPARAIFDLMRAHPDQRRVTMVWDELLAHVAATKCHDQAHADWTGHVDPEGRGPNQWVRRAGYRLPAYYPDGAANSIESVINGGPGTVEQAWQAWMDSPPHRTHLLGLNAFFAGQTHVGVGYIKVEGSAYVHYWVALTAPEYCVTAPVEDGG